MTSEMDYYQVIAEFEETVLPHVIKQYGHDDRIAIRTAFNDYVDYLNKEGQISDYDAFDMDNPY
jgi:hypothetical protein